MIQIGLGMSAKKKINFSRSAEINYEHDMISTCIYCWDPDIQDIAIVIQVQGEYAVLPFKACSEANKRKNPSTFSSDESFNLKPKARKIAFSDNDISTEMEPSSNFKHNSWNNLQKDIFAEVFGAEDVASGQPRLLYILRVYSPILESYSCHVIYGVQIGVPEINKVHMVKNYLVLGRQELISGNYKLPRNKIHWILEELYKNTLINEKFSYSVNTSSIWNASSTADNANLNGHYAGGAITEELNPQIIFDKTKSHQIISPVALFDSPGFTYLDRLRLYEVFVHLSFPYNTVDFRSIKPLLTELGFSGREEKAFRALDENYCGECDIYQFMLGITAMDPLTEHGNGPAEFRCRQIYRYYDEDKDGFLCAKDLEDMIIDISKFQNKILSIEQIKINIEDAFKVFDVLPSEKVTISKFLVSVGNLRFRGTSLLFRSLSSIPLILKKFRDRWGEIRPDKTDLKKKKLGESRQSFSIIPAAAAKAVMNNNLKFKQNLLENDSTIQDDDWWQPSFGYILAQHTVSVRRSGFISNVSSLLDMERAGEVCNTGLETLEESDENMSSASSSLNTSPTKNKYRVKKQVSAQAFNIKSLPNELLSALRFFESPVKDKAALSWGQIDKSKLAKYITTLCESLKEICASEQRLVHISSPCYILGDLHGNYHDLICFEKALWRLGPHLTPANFLFLGDYVDRGDYGIEVVAYLFAQKLKAPNRFHLLRGNHEVREIQQTFTFYSECIRKFGPQIGIIVWEEINQVFDRMPLAAIVDKKIFCIHGGVPDLNGPLNFINDIPCPLSFPESQSPLAWQLMWNDPVSPDELSDDLCKQLKENLGFADNLKRQTALVFDEKAFERFLEKHKITHVIRAHEVKQNGFEIQQSGRLFTVFSSSQYCGANNEAACILVHDLRIRIIRIDTT